VTRSRKRKLARLRAKWAGVPLASALIAGGGVAFAADTTDTNTLEDVVVTAQKRSEDLQKVPISLQVLNSETLEQHQVSNFDDYAKLLPSVSFQSLGPGQSQVYFRGIASGEDGLHAGSLPTTGVYLDEIPVTTIGNTLDVHMYDIARVEALAGPQGTLYGASSLSGTLRIITNKPDPGAFAAGYDVKGDKFGKGNAGEEFEGFVNVPLSDNIAVRLVGYYDHQGGYINNVVGENTYQRGVPGTPVGAFTGPDEPLTVSNLDVSGRRSNPVDTYGGRGALKVDLNDTWTITPQVLWQSERSDGNLRSIPRRVTSTSPTSPAASTRINGISRRSPSRAKSRISTCSTPVAGSSAASTTSSIIRITPSVTMRSRRPPVRPTPRRAISIAHPVPRPLIAMARAERSRTRPSSWTATTGTPR